MAPEHSEMAEGMSIKAMREFLSSRKIDYRDCVEKSDLKAKVNATMEAEKASSAPAAEGGAHAAPNANGRGGTTPEATVELAAGWVDVHDALHCRAADKEEMHDELYSVARAMEVGWSVVVRRGVLRRRATSVGSQRMGRSSEGAERSVALLRRDDLPSSLLLPPRRRDDATTRRGTDRC